MPGKRTRKDSPKSRRPRNYAYESNTPGNDASLDPDPVCSDRQGSGESPLHIPRPPNPWILFRSDFNRRQIRESKTRQAFVSQDASKEWRKASKEDLAYWRQKADEALDAHRKLYPNYVYKPQRGKGKKKDKRKKVAPANGLSPDDSSGTNSDAFTTPYHSSGSFTPGSVSTSLSWDASPCPPSMSLAPRPIHASGHRRTSSAPNLRGVGLQRTTRRTRSERPTPYDRNRGLVGATSSPQVTAYDDNPDWAEGFASTSQMHAYDQSHYLTAFSSSQMGPYYGSQNFAGAASSSQMNLYAPSQFPAGVGSSSMSQAVPVYYDSFGLADACPGQASSSYLQPLDPRMGDFATFSSPDGTYNTCIPANENAMLRNPIYSQWPKEQGPSLLAPPPAPLHSAMPMGPPSNAIAASLQTPSTLAPFNEDFVHAIRNPTNPQDLILYGSGLAHYGIQPSSSFEPSQPQRSSGDARVRSDTHPAALTSQADEASEFELSEFLQGFND